MSCIDLCTRLRLIHLQCFVHYINSKFYKPFGSISWWHLAMTSYNRKVLVLLCLILISGKVVLLSYKFKGNPDLDGKDCALENNSFSTGKIVSKHSCVQLCIDAFPSCKSIFFSGHQTKSQCYGCFKRYLTNEVNLLGNLSGSKYYGTWFAMKTQSWFWDILFYRNKFRQPVVRIKERPISD